MATLVDRARAAFPEHDTKTYSVAPVGLTADDMEARAEKMRCPRCPRRLLRGGVNKCSHCKIKASMERARKQKKVTL